MTSADNIPKSREPSAWNRLQLLCGLSFMLAISLLVHLGLNSEVLRTDNFQNTILAATAAHIAGYLSYRRFDIFPGMVSYGAILPTFLLSYGAAFLVVLLFRLDYSRLQLLISFVASISWYLASGAVGMRLRPYCLAVVPGGQTNRLGLISNVSWMVLKSPKEPLPAVHGVVADLRTDHSEAWERFLARCALSGTPVYHVKQVLESLTGKVQIDHLSENTLGSVNPNQLFILVKQAIDWVLALAVLVMLLPLLLAVALLVRLDSSGPALFRQERTGYRGRTFIVYKFRTMHYRASREDRDEKEYAMTGTSDARITRVGGVLRRTRIDELPQILNILRGEMSWIGPRPEALALSRWYADELPFYQYRHVVRPGITGWAQVNQGHVTELEDVHEKLHYDFYYIKNFSPWLDFSIIVKTIFTVVTGFGSR